MRTSATVALCLISGMMGGGTVAMMGAAQQLQPDPTTPTPNPSKDMGTEIYVSSVTDALDRAKLAVGVRPPVMAAAPENGFVLVVTASGTSYVVDRRGEAIEVLTKGTRTPMHPDLWMGTGLNEIDAAVMVQMLSQPKTPGKQK